MMTELQKCEKAAQHKQFMKEANKERNKRFPNERLAQHYEGRAARIEDEFQRDGSDIMDYL